jgi:hypothetical protein
VGSSGSSADAISQIADWQSVIEKRILAEASRIHDNIDVVESRLHDSNSFISALQGKVRDGSVFTSSDMQQLLKLQKERDRLVKELDEYKSLNLRALMKVAKSFHDAGGSGVYNSLLPRVLQQVSSPGQMADSRGWNQNLDTFFPSRHARSR